MTKKNPRPTDTVAADLETLRVQVAQLNIPGKRTLAKKTLAEFEAHNAATAHILLNRAHVDNELHGLKSAHATAHAALADAEHSAKSLGREIAKLEPLLTAADRAAGAKKDIAAATLLVSAAQATVGALLAAKSEIQTRIDTEAAALHRARDQAGAALLAEIKNGGTGKALPVSGERLETLRHALQAADSELVVAESELADHLAILQAAEDEHAEAVADAHLKALYIATREYAKVLACAQTAAAACGRYFVAPDVDVLVREIQHADAHDMREVE